MSTRWKTVKKKNKHGGRHQPQKPQDQPKPKNQNKNQKNQNVPGKKKKRKNKKKRQPQHQHEEIFEEVVPKKLPIGASGAPKLSKVIQNQNKKKRKNRRKKKKKYTNEEKIEKPNQEKWFDPNQLHDPTNDDSYKYQENATIGIDQNMAEKIKRNREKKGWSRAQFAEMINEDVSVVSDYERGTVKKVQHHILKKMSKVLKTNLGRIGKKENKKKDKYYVRD